MQLIRPCEEIKYLIRANIRNPLQNLPTALLCFLLHAYRPFRERHQCSYLFFFFNHPPPTEIYPLPLPDALPILTASLRRLDTDCVDVYQLHINELPVAEASDLVGACEDLVAEGLIRTYGWSTDDPERVDVFADRKSTSELQSQSNLVCRLLLANK